MQYGINIFNLSHNRKTSDCQPFIACKIKQINDQSKLLGIADLEKDTYIVSSCNNE